MELGFTHKAWEKWASHNIGSSGEPLKAAMLLNYDLTGPSRLLSIIAEQRGIIGKPVELVSFLDYVKRNNLPRECFVIGSNQYMVTSIHESFFYASKAAGEGVIVMGYEGSIGSATDAMVAGRFICVALKSKKSLNISMLDLHGNRLNTKHYTVFDPISVNLEFVLPVLLFYRTHGSRKASHVALECTLESHPNMEIASSKLTLFDLTKQICDAVQTRAEQDKNHGVILLPEGIIESIPEVYALLQEIHGLHRQAAASSRIDDSAQLSQIETETSSSFGGDRNEQVLVPDLARLIYPYKENLTRLTICGVGKNNVFEDLKFIS
ncbi:hypothetical protein IFM89_026936 [Coptis chinensis]|uniref:Uncharacterized protein n=1 Tax=Coptis chinensis TaxID=261450 RepID=A0A835I4E9_9MAGN|nr:hypothetical protein IFM89_026936 [Coptis chinensis]